MANPKQIRIEITAEMAGVVIEGLESKSRELAVKIAELHSLLGTASGAVSTGLTSGV